VCLGSASFYFNNARRQYATIHLSFDCKRSLRFIIGLSCVVRVSALVRSVARFRLTVARYNSVIGSNALFCCDRYSWSLDDLLRGSIHLSNFALVITCPLLQHRAWDRL